MRVWITRTEPGAARLAAAIEQLGLSALVAPVLHIEPRRTRPPQGPFDFALFVSEHAVVHAAGNGWRRAPWRGCPTAAIGAATSAALRAHGVEPCMAAQADAAGVVQALPALPATTLIVKGEGGRDLLQRELRRDGGTVVEWDVYRRAIVQPDLADEAIDAIVASSGDGRMCRRQGLVRRWPPGDRADLRALAARCGNSRANGFREHRCYTRRQSDGCRGGARRHRPTPIAEDEVG